VLRESVINKPRFSHQWCASTCGWRISNTLTESVCRPTDGPVEPDGVRLRFGVRFQKPLPTLQLTAKMFGINPNQARHKLGPTHPALPHQKIPLPFFSLLPNLTTHHPTHNRAVCTANRAARYIYNRIIALWKTHRPTMPGAWVTNHWPESVAV
jgi:hypothetical protein